MDVVKECKPMCSRAYATSENLDPPHLTLGSCLNREVGTSLSLLAVKKEPAGASALPTQLALMFT